MQGRVKLNKYTLLGAFRDFVLLVKNFVLFDYSNGKYPQESSSWCKCGHCTLKRKAIESFCCQEKALEYDEYDALLKEAEAQGGKC